MGYPTNAKLRRARSTSSTLTRLSNWAGWVYWSRATEVSIRTPERKCLADLGRILVLMEALVSGTPFLLLALRPGHREPDCHGTRPDTSLHVKSSLALLNLPRRTTGEPPRRADYTPLTLPIRPPSTIPMLRPEFFQSDFWHHFHAQSKFGITPSPRCETSVPDSCV